jgi:hypothetical protein
MMAKVITATPDTPLNEIAESLEDSASLLFTMVKSSESLY